MIVSSLHLCRSLSGSSHQCGYAYHVVLPPHECCDSVSFFAGSFIYVSELFWRRNGRSNNGGDLNLGFALTSVVSCRRVDPLLKLLCRQERDCSGAGQVGHTEETGLHGCFRASHAMR